MDEQKSRRWTCACGINIGLFGNRADSPVVETDEMEHPPPVRDGRLKDRKLRASVFKLVCFHRAYEGVVTPVSYGLSRLKAERFELGFVASIPLVVTKPVPTHTRRCRQCLRPLSRTSRRMRRSEWCARWACEGCVRFGLLRNQGFWATKRKIFLF